MTPACSADLAGLCETLATVLGASRGRFRRPFPPAHLLAEGLGIRASQILSAGREGVVLTGTIPPELTRLQDGYCEGRTRCLHKPSRSSVRGEHAGEGCGRWSGAYMMGVRRSLLFRTKPGGYYANVQVNLGLFCSQISGNIQKFGKGNTLLRLLDIKWRWKPAGRFLLFRKVKAAGRPEPGLP